LTICPKFTTMPGMPLIIDGHNLIPKVSGISLSDLEDEMHLVQVLQEYARIRRIGQVEIFFDRAPAGHPRKRKFGAVRVQFSTQGSSADAEIEMRLRQLGRQAHNWTVASSDQRVRKAAREAGAREVSSEQLAMELEKALFQANEVSDEADQAQIGQEEVEMWLELFRTSRKNQED